MSTEKHQIIVSDLVVDVVRKDIKNLHLAVYPPAGRVRVAVPLRVNDEAVRLFTISRLSWIKRQQAKFTGQERQSARVCERRKPLLSRQPLLAQCHLPHRSTSRDHTQQQDHGSLRAAQQRYLSAR